METEDFYRLTIGMEIFWKGEKVKIDDLKENYGKYIGFVGYRAILCFCNINHELSFEPPKEKKREKVNVYNLQDSRGIMFTCGDLGNISYKKVQLFLNGEPVNLECEVRE